MQHEALTVRNLNVWYNGLHALRQVSLPVYEHKITAFIGASGSGKSTLLRAINRMLDLVPQARADGEIVFQKQNALDAETDVIALRRQIGMLFQNPTPFPKSIYDNVSYGLEIQGARRRQHGTWSQRLMGNVRIVPAVLEKSTHLLDQAVVKSLREAALWDEVKDRLHQSAWRLSGGQQQRLCIARAIAVRPQILLLDEPCSELDPISTNKIEQLLISLKERYTIVIVTHSMHQAKRISDYVGFFHLGELKEFGPTAQIFEHAEQKITHDYVHGIFG